MQSSKYTICSFQWSKSIPSTCFLASSTLSAIDLVYQVIQDIFDEKKLVILEMNGEADHIHILFEADPFTAPGTLVNIIKTKTSRYARKEYGETLLKEYYWKPLFWSDSYFVTTVSENSLQMVQEYIKNQ